MNQQATNTTSVQTRLPVGGIVSYSMVAVAILVLPLVILGVGSPIANMWHGVHAPLSLFAACTSLAVVTSAYMEVNSRRGRPVNELLPIILGL